LKEKQQESTAPVKPKDSMPNQKKNKKKGGGKGKGKPKQKNKVVTNSPRKMTMGNSQNSLASVIRSGPTLSFSTGSRPGCLKMSYNFRACQVVGTSNTAAPAMFTSQVAFKVNGSGTPAYSYELPLNPAATFYWPPFIAQLMNLFNEFRVLSCGVEFQPRAPTTTVANYSFTWSYAEDPEWVESHGLTTGGIANPTEATITTLSGACTVLPWAPCSIRATISDKKMRYVAGSITSARIDYGNAFAATVRQGIPGTFLLRSESAVASSPSDTLIGDVYVHLVMELCDFSTPITSVVSLDSKRRAPDEEKIKEERTSLSQRGGFSVSVLPMSRLDESSRYPSKSPFV
jgi:hypothetical protein